MVGGDLAEHLFQVYWPERLSLLRGFDMEKRMTDMLALIRDKNLSYPEMADRAALWLHQLLIAMRRFAAGGNENIQSRIKDYIDDHLDEPLNLEEISRRFGYSRNYLIQLFGTAYGTTPYAYYEKQKMQIARELLLYTQSSVKEVAARLGFENPQYFSKCFRKHFGCPPARFRRGNR